METAHRSGPLKQQNKGHKTGSHRSKRALQTAHKGKVDAKTVTKSSIKDLRKHERRNKMQQIRKSKRDELVASKRALGVEDKPPLLVGIMDLSKENNLSKLLDLVKDCDQDADINVNELGNLDCMFSKLILFRYLGSLHVAIPRFKLRYQFILPDKNNLFDNLDLVKIVDVLLIVHPLTLESTNYLDNNEIFNCVYSHCLPTTVHVIDSLEACPAKKKHEFKKSIQKVIEDKFPGEKLHSVENSQEALQLLHQIGACKRRKIAFRSHRSQVLAEKLEFIPVTGERFGTMKVSGYVRNRNFDANRLVHIPGWGDYQIELLEAAEDPNPLKNKRKNEEKMVVEGSKIIQKSDPMNQESLDIENIPDPMEGEQTWPTPEEIAASQAENKKIIKKVPVGTSAYQAAWIIDSEDEEEESEDSEDEESDDDRMDIKPSELEKSDESEDENESIEDTMTMTEVDDDHKYDEKIGSEDDALEKFREARQQEMFPDEVDTPKDVPAKVRFARFRGLKSFHYSPWDPKENLPSDYSRIFQFENFNRTRKRIFKDLDDSVGADVGAYVVVHVKNVPEELVNKFKQKPNNPLILYGLLPHEQKMSVCNFVIKKHSQFAQPIKSKERLIFHVGCRRYAVSPIFSSHTHGDKFKYEKFLPNDAAVVATVYAPITFPPASVLVMKEFEDGTHQLVATGTLMSVNPDRVVVKRIVLSGHPFKITKKAAVVRYMFFNRDDIMWFKPVELRSKYGRKGHIREPLGTHGHMKCIFDRPLKSNDTVLMNLYKRVYPKWTYDPIVTHPCITQKMDE